MGLGVNEPGEGLASGSQEPCLPKCSREGVTSSLPGAKSFEYKTLAARACPFSADTQKGMQVSPRSAMHTRSSQRHLAHKQASTLCLHELSINHPSYRFPVARVLPEGASERSFVFANIMKLLS